ncbi:integrin beta-3-like [Pecten maximus]|uniref:integrin beta-3-like n=1 Tax=Pecten maximus TaxID=6579 RepID=UPI001458E7DE|nr:integrin beta-3-like [Pecten maximus]XP_033746291.1 integrin beta-3-like [Pecten maximus]
MKLDSLTLEIVIVTCYTFLSGYRSQSTARRSPQCSNQGELVKGLCACFPGYSGYDCSKLDPSLELSCINPHTSVEMVCSGRGQCVGGRCECARRRSRRPDKFSGEYCECDDYTCPFYMGQMCGGNARGRCRCGECQCGPDYTGKACGCSSITEGCIASDGSLCNNQGSCVCGYCQCDKDSVYRGVTCEENPSNACQDLKQCIQCRVFGSGPLSKADCANDRVCSNLRIHSVEKFIESRSEYICEFKDEDDCLFRFGYSYEQTGTKLVQAWTIKQCGRPEYTEVEEESSPKVNPVQSDAPTGFQEEGDTADTNGGIVHSFSLFTTVGTVLLVLLQLS